MAETTARQILIASLIFGAIITGGFIWISGAMPTDPGNDFREYNNTFNKFQTLKYESEQIQSSIEDAKPTSGLLGILNGLIESSWGALRLVWTSVSTMSTIFSNLSSMLGVPVWLTSLFIGLIGIVLAFALMAAWFKWHI